MTRLEILNRDREALAGLHARLVNPSRAEYNALVHAIWRIDSELNQLTDKEGAEQ